MKRHFVSFFCMALILAQGFTTLAQKTEVKYLSGTGNDQTVDWQFFITEERGSGEWTTIPVPSNWELQGFGKYNYGHAQDSVRGKETGLYKYEFEVAAHWQHKTVNIVFEGSMTDTEVRINGQSAGPVHQGAFYQFKHDVSSLLRYGSTNTLEVTVAKHSANESVNRAERHADYWIFGGIFRPVYLEALPREHVQRVAIDAKADGFIKADVFLRNIGDVDKVTAKVTDLNGNPIGSEFSASVNREDSEVQLQSTLPNVKPWNPEEPNLYLIDFRLESEGKVVHEMTERIGFRTVEVRERDGIYVNGVKVRFKGVNRHTFRPETGRASSRTNSIEDVKLIKEMNMNAVRMSHYPPDKHFLEICDSLGLFVLNELGGWHNAYDTEVGTKLVRSMVTRDVNHPCIVIWNNGNEGGTNTELDALFKQYDIQNRPVIHPWRIKDGIDNEHYINYDYGMGTYWHGPNIVFPTEFLHGLYDGGHGAGLYDFWELIWNKPRAAGGFLWDFADQGVVRTDEGGKLDTHGSAGADGILGPHHEKEGSFFAIKEIWSPVRFEEKLITAAFDGHLNLENRYLYSNLNTCTFTWELKELDLPNKMVEGKSASGTANAPDVAPGAKGQLVLNLPADWYGYDVLYVSATDQAGMEIYTWSFPISLPKDVIEKMISLNGSNQVTVTEQDSIVLVSAGGIEFTIGKQDGLLKKVVNGKGEIPFNNGPQLSAGVTVFEKMDIKNSGDSVQITCTFDDKESRMKEVVWTVYPSGWVKLDIIYVPEEYDVHFDYMGIDFSYPEENVKAVRWLGDGPYRVWKNRMHGVELDVHEKEYNTTMTGIPPLVYPEFKGYHSRLYWAEIITTGQPFVVATSTENVFLRLFTPDQPEQTYHTAPPFPDGDISFMQGIPPIGTKSQQAWRLGPSGQKNQFFDFGPYDSWRSRGKYMTLFFDFSAR